MEVEWQRSHGKPPRAWPHCPGSSPPAPEAGPPGPSVWRIPASMTLCLLPGDCHTGAVIQGLPRQGESRTCSLPAAEAAAWGQRPCVQSTQPILSLASCHQPPETPGRPSLPSQGPLNSWGSWVGGSARPAPDNSVRWGAAWVTPPSSFEGLACANFGSRCIRDVVQFLSLPITPLPAQLQQQRGQ